jgi:N-acyl-D-amino-acid deacylase
MWGPMTVIRITLLLFTFILTGWSTGARADDKTQSPRQAAEKGLALIAASAKTYTEERKCFSCHHQSLPVFALRLAESCGLTVDRPAVRHQSEFTHRYFSERQADAAQGKSVPGGPYSAGYALLSLAADEWPADETTSALVEYLCHTQEENGSWKIRTHRPPLEDSHFTPTALAVRSLSLYAGESQRADASKRIERARQWLIESSGESHEDRVFRLFGLSWSGAANDEVAKGCAQLLRTQRDDGGWSQSSELCSDAYATGTALTALRLAGGLSADHKAYQTGVRWLLEAQCEDGSWLVTSRSKPFQTYFESGFPHEKSQFISISGTCWAVMALLLADAGLDVEASAGGIVKSPLFTAKRAK